MLNAVSEWIAWTWAVEYAVLVLFTAAVIVRCGLSFYYGRKAVHARDILHTKDKLLKQIALKYENCYRLNGAVANTEAMIDKFFYRERKLGLKLMTWIHFCAFCKVGVLLLCTLQGAVRYALGGQWSDILLSAGLGIYVLLALELFERLADTEGKRAMVQCLIEDYLENVLAEKLVMSGVGSRREALEQALEQQKSEKIQSMFAQNVAKAEQGKNGKTQRKLSMQEADVITDVLEEYL